MSAERLAASVAWLSRRQEGQLLTELMASTPKGEWSEATAYMQAHPDETTALYSMDMRDLTGLVLGMAGKTRPCQPRPPAAAPSHHKILEAQHKSVMVQAPVDTGWFTGYLAAIGNRDDQGDTIEPGGLDATLAAFKAGNRQWLLTDAHSEKASDVVAEVVDATVDGTGLWVQARWMPTERAQQLRAMVKAGARLGLSIDYLPERARPDGMGGRRLQQVAVLGGAVVTHPANGLATIREGKATAGVAQVVSVGQEIAIGAARRDPDRGRLERMAEVVAASWPSPGLVERIGVEAAYSMVERSAAAKAAREVAGDPERAAARARWERLNAYSNGLRSWMDRQATMTGCGRCQWCVRGVPDQCVYR